MLLLHLGGRYRDITWLTSTLHEVASFNCILVRNSPVLLTPDDVGIFLINFAIHKILGCVKRFRGVEL